MLEDLINHAQQLPAYDLSSWTPIFKGDMDLVIAADGQWIHQGSKSTTPVSPQVVSSVSSWKDRMRQTLEKEESGPTGASVNRNHRSPLKLVRKSTGVSP